jgi:hypothetical protein
MGGDYAAKKRWQRYDGNRLIGLTQSASIDGYEWHQTWDNGAYGTSLTAPGGIAENLKMRMRPASESSARMTQSWTETPEPFRAGARASTKVCRQLMDQVSKKRWPSA